MSAFVRSSPNCSASGGCAGRRRQLAQAKLDVAILGECGRDAAPPDQRAGRSERQGECRQRERPGAQPSPGERRIALAEARGVTRRVVAGQR
jgi:hypothetical protein